MPAPTRAQFVRGPGYINWNSVNMHSVGDIEVNMEPIMASIETSDCGEIDQVPVDRIFKVSATLWGDLSFLATLFPSVLLNPQPGTSLFGASDLPLTIYPANGADQRIFANAQITKMADLYVGLNQNFFSAAVEFTCLLAGGAQPVDNNAYSTLSSPSATPDSAFTRTATFARVRYTAGWSGVTGFTAGTVFAKEGFKLSWALGLAPVTCDGFGTVDYTVKQMKAMVSFIPVGPTGLQIDAAGFTKSAASTGSTEFGVLASTIAADFTLTPQTHTPAPIIVLKKAFLAKSGQVYSQDKLRNGEMRLETTRIITSGVPVAVASFA